jgi:hypothetical protein
MVGICIKLVRNYQKVKKKIDLAIFIKQQLEGINQNYQNKRKIWLSKIKSVYSQHNDNKRRISQRNIN